MAIYKYNDDWMVTISAEHGSGIGNVDMKFTSEYGAKEAFKKAGVSASSTVTDYRGHRFFDVDTRFFWIWEKCEKDWKLVWMK